MLRRFGRTPPRIIYYPLLLGLSGLVLRYYEQAAQ